MSWAIDLGIRPDNPCARVKKPPQRKPERYLSREEAGRLLNAIEELESAFTIQPAYGDVIRLLLLTGARKSEIQKLRWAEVDLDRGAIALPRERSKTGEKSIALSQATCAIIARQVHGTRCVSGARRRHEIRSRSLETVAHRACACRPRRCATPRSASLVRQFRRRQWRQLRRPPFGPAFERRVLQ
jgi:integrase